MKNRLKFLVLLVVFMFILVPKINASVKIDSIKNALKDGVSYHATDNSVYAEYSVREKVDEIVNNYEGVYYNLDSCNYDSCDITINDSSTSSNETVNVKINRTGVILDEDILVFEVGDKYTIDYKYLDEDGKEKTFDVVKLTERNSTGLVEIKGTEITIKKAGYTELCLQLISNDDNYENDIYYEIKVFSNFQEFIENKVSSLTSLNIITNSNYSTDDPKNLIYDALFNAIFGEYSFTTEGDKTCVDDKDCSGKDGIFNIDLTLVIRDKNILLRKII